MNRRSLLLGAASTGVLPWQVLRAQEKPHRVGFLAVLSRSTPAHPDVFYDAFVQGMRDLGYIEGKNLSIEWRFADGKFDRLHALAAELTRANVEVIVTHSTPGIRALQGATQPIPIVFATAIDPVGSGFAASLARPGGNITGLAIIGSDLHPKRLELLKVMLPGMTRAAVLANPGTSAHVAVIQNVQGAADRAKVQITVKLAGTESQIRQAFATMPRDHITGAVIADDAFFRGERQHIAELALESHVAVIAPWKEFAAAGGLMSFGQDILGSYRSTASYVDRILKGARPADLPIEQPSQIELVLNRRTAKQLGISIPQDLLLRADQVIG